MDKPLVSVVLSVFNGEKYLSEAIDSILTQSYKNFEFIIINDGSTDSSLEIIRSYNDKRIIIISRENKGLIESLNEGIRKARGKYIVRMDADDISLIRRLEKQVTFMEDNPNIGMSGSDVLIFKDSLKISIWNVPKSDTVIKSELLFSSPFAHPSVIINRELIFKHHLFYDSDFLHAEDFELWTRVAKVTKMENISEILLKYRLLEDSITREANKNIDKRYAIHKKILNMYLNQLGLTNTEKENRIHFNISLHQRIKDNDIDFEVLEKYFNKLLIANKNNNIFNSLEIKKVLGKKWLAAVYYKKNFSRVFSKYYFYGILALIGKI